MAAPTQHIVLLQALRNAPDRIAEVMAGVDDAWQPGPEAWSAREAVSHLAACDPLFLQRFKRILELDNPLLPRFGPDVAAPRSDIPITESLNDLRQSRATLIEFLSALPPEEWERPAIHETLGPSTLALQVQNMLNHDAEHLGQLMELRQAWHEQTERA